MSKPLGCSARIAARTRVLAPVTALRTSLSAVLLAAGLVGSAGSASAGTITQPTGNPFVVPGDPSGNPLPFTIVASGYVSGSLVSVEQCDGTPPTAQGWSPTVNCDLGSSPAAVIVDANGVATFNAGDPNHAFHPFKGPSPQGLFNCLSPNDPSPNNGLPDFRNCQVRVSTNNSVLTADQAFLTIQLPNTVTGTTTSTTTTSTSSTTTSSTSTTTATAPPTTTTSSTTTTTQPPASTTTSTTSTTHPTTTMTSTTTTSTPPPTTTSTSSSSTTSTTTTRPPTTTSTSTTSTSTTNTTSTTQTSTTSTTHPSTSTTAVTTTSTTSTLGPSSTTTSTTTTRPPTTSSTSTTQPSASTSTTSSSTTTTTVPSTAQCPQGLGFWKHHPERWPVSSLTLGSQTYAQAELLALLTTPPRGDASVILARALIPAKLNIANGSDPTPIVGTIADADDLLDGFAGKLPLAVRPGSDAGRTMVDDAGILEQYNSGALTPRCSEAASGVEDQVDRVAAACAGHGVPPGLQRRLARGRRLLARVGTRPGMQAQQLLRQAATQLARAVQIGHRAAHAGKLSAECSHVFDELDR